MRISIRKVDAHYHPLSFTCHVLLNGKELDNCIAADDVGGWCDVYVYGDNGRILIDRGQLKTERLRGEVRIVLPAKYTENFEDWRI